MVAEITEEFSSRKNRSRFYKIFHSVKDGRHLMSFSVVFQKFRENKFAVLCQ